MKLSIVIPSYNSKGRLTKLLEKLFSVNFPISKEVIVVNDGSVGEEYERVKRDKKIIYIGLPSNQGKGAAVKEGFEKATGNILFILDDDLEYDPFDIPKLISPIIEGKEKVVYGSRLMNGKNPYSSIAYYIGGLFIDKIISFFLRKKLSDPITGSKAIARDVYLKIKPIETNGFEIDTELTAKIIKKGFNILEIPINYNPRTHKEGKNIRWYDFFPIFKTLLKYSF